MCNKQWLLQNVIASELENVKIIRCISWLSQMFTHWIDLSCARFCTPPPLFILTAWPLSVQRGFHPKCRLSISCTDAASLAELLWQFASDFASVFCVCFLNSHYYYYYRASLLFCDLSISMSTWQQQKITQSMRFEICNQPSQLEMEILEFIGLNHCSSWAAPTHHGPSLVERTQSKISTVYFSPEMLPDSPLHPFLQLHSFFYCHRSQYHSPT